MGLTELWPESLLRTPQAHYKHKSASWSILNTPLTHGQHSAESSRAHQSSCRPLKQPQLQHALMWRNSVHGIPSI